MDDARASTFNMIQAEAKALGCVVIDDEHYESLLADRDTLDEIRNRLNSNLGSSVHALIQDIANIVSLTPPRVPQVGDMVRHKQNREHMRRVLDVLDDGKTLRLTSNALRVGFLVETDKWEVVE